MSGKKQHYIPQFLLRSFGESAGGKKIQVRVSTRDRQFIVPTDGAAAQREFYSRLDSEEETLDDVITSAETEYYDIFRRLCDQNIHSIVDGTEVSRLLSHLAARGNYIRQSLATFGRYATNQIMETFSHPDNFKRLLGVDQPEPSPLMREKFDNIYNEKRDLMRKSRINRHQFRKLAFSILKEKWKEFFDENIPDLRLFFSTINFSDLATDGHQKVLRDNIEPFQKVETLSQLGWAIVDLPEDALALPDCVALAHYPDIGVMPLGFVGKDDLTGVIFPVSPRRAVCGGSYTQPSLARTLIDGFNVFSAVCSWDFVVTPPSYSNEWVPQDRIGNAIIKMMFEAMEKSLSEHLIESSL